VSVTRLESGPLRGRLQVRARYDWPIGLLPGGVARSASTAPVDVATTIELRVGEPFLRVALEFVNPASDHRVRWHVPLPQPTDHSSAEGQFAVVDRGLTEEAGHGEVPTPTFPAHGFVNAAGMTVLLDHVTEYELIDGRELALTVLRSTGLISRNENPYREDPAGPEVPVPGAQLLGPWRVGFALMPHAGSWERSGVLAASEAYHHPFLVAQGSGTGTGNESAPSQGFRLDGDGVVLSSLRRREEWLEARLVAQRSTPTRATVGGSGPVAAARDVDLLGRTGAEIAIEPDGTLAIDLGPWEIRTLQIRFDRPS
jgi:alpha-mannosidase